MSRHSVADSSSTRSNNDEISKRFKKKTQIEHILSKPGMYIGSIEMASSDMYSFNSLTPLQENKTLSSVVITKQTIEYIPGLIRIFEEILLNAYDQSVRSGTNNTTEIRVEVKDNSISVYNNGEGIPIIYKDEYECYIPEMIFGQLLTSSNYDDNEKRITGGTNGLGAKLTNIFSSLFELETIDSNNKISFKMCWMNSMSDKSNPIIKKTSNKPFTRITFKPDLAKFKLNELTTDIINLIKKRVIDISFNTSRLVRTYFNGENITIKKPEDYIKLYFPEAELIIVDQTNERWIVGVTNSNIGFNQISFVNGIHTTSGGSHVDHIMSLICKEIAEKLKSKKIDLKPADIKNKICIFVKAVIENPVFNSQTKDQLAMPKSKFGSEYIMDEKFKKKLLKSSIVTDILEYSKFKLNKTLKKTDGSKTSRIFDIEHLEDANLAGKIKSSQCKLIVTEGLSAKTYAMSALSVIGRDKYGIFPLKGKILNVRGVATQKVTDNKEICNLIKILGLKHGEKYTDFKSLRYGGIVSLTDADSVTGDTPLLLREKNTNKLVILPIEDITENFIKDELNGKEYGTTHYQTWTSNGWTDIKQVMRHKVSKDIYRVLTHTGLIDVTEDHSLLDIDANIITPNECVVGDELLHSFPIFTTKRELIPDNFEQMTAVDLRKLTYKLCLNGTSYVKKQVLIDRIKEYKNQDIYKFNNYSDITDDEAFVMGLFAADGSCGIYEWKNTYKANNRPRAYTSNRVSFTWAICNGNTKLLEKSQNILNEIYGNYFTIHECKSAIKGPNSINPSYKLILNGGKTTKWIIEKYRNLFYYNKYKYIHSYILNSNYSIRKQFFDGYYAGDGRHNMNVPMTMDVNSKLTTQCLFILCKSLGYSVTINHCMKKDRVINMNISKTNKGTQNPNKIKKIWKLETKEDIFVYDLETENHHFQAGVGQLSIHNTDGIHIHGLLLNLFHYFWPELLELNYVYLCSTPIVKVSRGKLLKSFHTLNDYYQWNRDTLDSKKWIVKYYKGLGTSTAKEAKEDLKDIEDKIIKFSCNSDTDAAINLGFNKKLTNERKEWLTQRYDPELNMDRKSRNVQISDFINRELIHFSYCDNQRSIPNVLDGFKPTQRKIIYCALKYLYKTEMKVAQFGAKVAEKTAYQHGEVSVMGTIVNMAQNYMGSNNINLLEPIGGFGTRLNNNDSASPRYIFTSLSPIAKSIFNDYDNKLLKYLFSDNTFIEPEWYIPCIPMVLINGAEGIGTGFSTEVLKYKLEDICEYIECKLVGKTFNRLLLPWYRGFKGTIVRLENNKYISYGVYSINKKERTLNITELPVGVWTDAYKKFIEDKWQKESLINNVVNNSDDVTIDLKIKFTSDNFRLIEAMNDKKIISEFNLSSRLSSTNMYLFDRNNMIRKFDSIEDILDYFYIVRHEYYEKRRSCIIDALKQEMLLLNNKIRFIQYVRSTKISILKVSNVDLINTLVSNKFDKIPKEDNEYKYLIDLPIRQITNEYANKLKNQGDKKQEELQYYENQTAMDLWKIDLDKIKTLTN